MKKRTQALLVMAVAMVTAFTMLLTGLPDMGTADASSHREAPLIADDPTADNTDLYAFVSPNDATKVTLLANFIPFEEPGGGPTYYTFDDNVVYQIRLDNSGNAELDLAIQFRFRTEVRNGDTFLYNTGQVTSLDDPDLNVRQFYNVHGLVRQGSGFAQFTLATDVPVPPVNIGPRSTPNYETALAEPAIRTVATGAGNIRLFAGQRDDGFYVDLASTFDLLGLRPFNPNHIIPRPVSAGVDTFAGYSVNTIGIEIPTSLITVTGRAPTGPTDPAAIIGFYSTASRPGTRVLNTNGTATVTGDCSLAQAPSTGCVQVSRLANPLFNELFIPRGTSKTVSENDKDLYNAQLPISDSTRRVFVQGTAARPVEPVALLNFFYPVIFDAPTQGRVDLVRVYLTGVPGATRPPFQNDPMDPTAGPGAVPSDLMRLNTAIPPVGIGSPGFNRLGVIAGDNGGYPNGRRVGDDVVDITLRVAAGVLLPGNACSAQNGTMPGTQSCNQFPNNALGDGVTQNDKPFRTTFPFLASPWSGYENPYHGRECSTTPDGACAPTATPRP
ncbi:MAG: DUF4331 domain-containing protein [Acidobacteriota bacterium]|jgi:hypothetical protein|nr:DUF4331 domain-containing protein [Acidobacteriota bacterium]